MNRHVIFLRSFACQQWVPYLSIIIACLFCILANIAAPTNGLAEESFSPTPIRAIHIVCKGVSTTEMKGLIDQASTAHFNVLILGIVGWGGTKLKSTPWVNAKNAWNREQLLDVVRYARSKSMEVVPNIELLTHQQMFLGKSHPELLYNPQTYDPSKPEVYKLIFPILDEIIDLLHPKAILIGHDELFGSPNRQKYWKTREDLLPAKLFLSDVRRIHDYLKARSVNTWMWGDMLISQDEFPKMNKDFLLGGIPGYGAVLREQLPKDIVICDWHYREKGKRFKTIDAFKRDGFRVIGATFADERTMRNFSRYAAQHGAEGMIATTWFYVQKKDWSKVDRIIDDSGKVFLKDFPDEK